MDSKSEVVPWSSGLCDCFSDVPSCCLTCWCPCITFGQISEIVDQGSSSCCGKGGAYFGIGIVSAALTGLNCGFLYSCSYRTKLRKHYSLEDGGCNDCLLHFFCESCALCQEHRELKARGFDMSLGWKGNMEKGAKNGMGSGAPAVEGGMTRDCAVPLMSHEAQE